MKIINSIKDYLAHKALEHSVYNQLMEDSNNFKRSMDATPPKKSSGGSSIVVGLAKRLGFRFGDLGSKDFEDPEYDLMDIDAAYDTDGYVRQGVDKYIEQIFKEGHKFNGKNPNAVEYIKLRFQFMAETTQIPMEQLFIDMAEDIVKYGNCIVAKARLSDQSQLPPGASVTGINGFEPIVGYFPLHPGTFKIKRDKNGLVKGWQQEVDGAPKPQKFKPEDIVHMYYKRKKGNAFGTPFLYPVLDDIRALRFLEENVLNMIYKHINPFIQAVVGDKDSPGSEAEISKTAKDLEKMESGGGIATSNRVELRSIATNNAYDAAPMLSYAENRVFSGLGIPAVKFGRGGTANRNTADSMTDEMSDRIKAFQNCIAMQINQFIIKELLMEGGFDPLNNPDDAVFFEFADNDLDRKIKSETHATFLFEHKAIDENEMRADIGREPITDRALMFDSLYGMEEGGGQGGTGAKKSGETDNKQKPTNQSGTKSSPKKKTNSIAEKIVLEDRAFIMENLGLNLFQANMLISVYKDRIKLSRLKDEDYRNSISERIDNTLDIFKLSRKGTN